VKQGDLFGAGPSSPVSAPKPAEPKSAPAAVPVAVAPRQQAAPAAAPREAVPAWRRPLEPALRPVWSVTDLTSRLKQAIEPAFRRVWVRGEVVGFRGANPRGHWYFAIKDEGASIDVRVWATATRQVRFVPRDGLEIIVEGMLNVYEPQGRYALIAERMEPAGLGAQALALEQLKEKLTKEGLMGPQRQKPKQTLPALPRRIGVATSVSGAALKDFLKVAHRRHPGLSVLVADARVQGEGAAWDVARAIRWLSKQRIDVLVVTRGGGSIDDLWAFNEEPVARALWACPVATISAVGHEVDVTLADLMADVRAPTPSAAAELVSPVHAELVLQVAERRARLHRAIAAHLTRRRAAIGQLARALRDPRVTLGSRRLRLNALEDRAQRLIRQRLAKRRAQLTATAARLQTLRPQSQLTDRRKRLDALRQALPRLMATRLAARHQHLSRLSARVQAQAPASTIRSARQTLMLAQQRLLAAMSRALDSARSRHGRTAASLEGLSPLRVLARGYALVTGPDGRVVQQADAVKPRDMVSIRLAKGQVLAEVHSSTSPSLEKLTS
jgi:exodeoxyribonuclease VII large subunit